MRYDTAARLVARLLAEHPGLRGDGPADEALVAELAAVRLFVRRDQEEFVASVREGGTDADRPFAICVAGGLRRLPSLQGVVVRGGPADQAFADAYEPGQELAEEAPLIAIDDLAAEVPGAVEVLIWSAAARRLTGLTEGPHAEVAFLPGTVFRVLAVDPPRPGAVRRVLLAEIPPGRSKPVTEEWTERMLGRLREAAEARADVPAAPTETSGLALPGDPASVARSGR